jgi:hypothetical protein
MKEVPVHAGMWLACALFVLLNLIGFVAGEESQSAKIADPLGEIKEFHSNFINQSRLCKPSLIQPQLSNKEIFFPKASVPLAGLDKFHSNCRSNSPNSKENVVMNESQSEEYVKDLVSLNANKQRDIVFDDSQNGDSMNPGLKNSLDITISGNGKGQSGANTWSDEGPDDVTIENLVDNATTILQHNDSVYYQSRGGSPAQQRLGNYLNIDVSGIDVKAINTVEGGSAVATSNIIIKPVQIINCPAEVQEKLK